LLPVFVGVCVLVGVCVGVAVFEAVGVGVISPKQSMQLFQGPLKIVAVSAKGVSTPGSIE
jgi:cytosine/uracil/thiamine/allantoin permease